MLNADPGSVVSLVGIKGTWLAGLLPARTPLGVAAVGALFALSFDTISQAALFAVTASQFGGVERALMLGTLFFSGMLASDGLNGWWISRLIARADQAAALASRVMSIAVSAVSLLVAALGVGSLLSPAFENWSANRELSFGAVVVLMICASYAAALALARSSAMHRQPA